MTDKDKLFSICWIPLEFNAEFPTTYLEELLFLLSDFFSLYTSNLPNKQGFPHFFKWCDYLSCAPVGR